MNQTTFVGQLTLGACIPTAAEAAAQISAGVGVSFSEVSAKLAGALDAQAQLTINPPSLATSLQAALDMVTNLQAAVALGLPGAIFDVSGVLSVIAELQATLGQLQASLDFAASLGLTLGTPGFYLYRYSGDVGQLGNGLQAELSGGLPTGGGPSIGVDGIILVAADAGAKAALSATFA